jgi:hypothetical protein
MAVSRAVLSLFRRPWLLAALLVLVQAVLLVRTALDKADTRDEPHYLAQGVILWTQPGTFSNCEAPILCKWGFAVALRVVDPVLFDPHSNVGRHPLWSRPPEVARRNLAVARGMTICLTLAAGLLLFSAARRYGTGAALLTLTLWVFSPSVLANGSLATLDGWATAMIAVAAWATFRAVDRPSLGRGLIVGIALGLAASAKVTTLALVPISGAVVAWSALRSQGVSRRRRWLWAASLTACLTLGFGAALWGVYGYQWGSIDLANPCLRDSLPRGTTVGPFPAPQWLAGFLAQWRHGQKGHLSYLFGESSAGGWWWFYLAALALKTTVGAQLLVVLRLGAWWRSRPDSKSLLADGMILAYPLILITVMSVGRTQNGIRFILPAFPLLLLWLGRAALDVPRAFGRWGRVGLGIALAAAIAESLAVHPHHLMFFNLWAGGPNGGPRYMIHGDDWGQDQRRLAEWQRVNHPWRLFYTRYTENPAHWGITYETPPCVPTPGYYALHAVEVHRPKGRPPGCLDWLTVEAPDARFGYSIYLYLVNKSRIERLQAERDHVRPFWRSAGAPPETAGDEGVP